MANIPPIEKLDQEPPAETSATSISDKNIWASIFGWSVLSRWDVLGTLIFGFFIAVGVSVLSIEWFPHNLLLGQICLGIAGVLAVTKAIVHSIEQRGSSLLQRAVFSLVISASIVGVDGYFIWQIQIRKLKFQESLNVPPQIMPRETSITSPNTKPVSSLSNAKRKEVARTAQFLADEILDYESQRERDWQGEQEQVNYPRPLLGQESNS